MQVNNAACLMDARIVVILFCIMAISQPSIALISVETTDLNQHSEIYAGSSVWAIDYAPNGAYLVISYLDNLIRVVNRQNWSITSELEGAEWGARPIEYANHGAHLFASDGADRVVRYETATWTQRESSIQFAGFPTELAVSADGRQLAVGLSTGTVAILATESLALIRTLNSHTGRIHGLDFSPDGRWLATGSEDANVSIWQIDTWTETAVVSYPSRIGDLLFSPDSELLLVAEGPNLSVMQTEEWIEIKNVEAHEDRIRSVDFNNDGSVAATGSSDGSFALWRSDSWERILRKSDASTVVQITFSPAGCEIAIGLTGSGTTSVWQPNATTMALRSESTVANLHLLVSFATLMIVTVLISIYPLLMKREKKVELDASFNPYIGTIAPDSQAGDANRIRIY